MSFRILLFAVISVITSHLVIAQELIGFNSSYKYLKGKDAGSLSSAWNSTGFNDATWNTGSAPYRYGDGTGGTLLSDMINSYSTVYLRKSINIPNPDSIKALEIKTNFDDGYIIYLNGNVITELNAPDNPTSNSLANGNHEFGEIMTYTVEIDETDLLTGINIIAIQCFNTSLSSSDFYFDLTVSVVPKLPEINDSLGIIFSHPSGYYSSPFDLVISSPDSALDIIYTVDCSKPFTSANRVVTKGDTLHIDPNNTDGGRGNTPAYVVKAALYKDGYESGITLSRTFIFPEYVKNQKYPGGGWPVSPVNNHVVDYEMDPEIVTDIKYKSQIDQALHDLPVISVSTDISNLYDVSSGIYSNPGFRGLAGERECNVELINIDTIPGFNINAGLRLRGGASRNNQNPKHSFRLFFRKKYGEGKLHYALFGEEGADEFDKIDLRTEQNYSWNGDAEQNTHNTFVRDIFSRDAQGEMGQPYAKGRYYHLYLNGMYWGIYQTQERTEASFAETYLGDDADDYDVIKVSPQNFPYTIETTDGNDLAWREIYNLSARGFNSNEQYFMLEGKDQYGKPLKNSKVLVDIDNLIDYMILVFYTGNYDAPASAFWGNKMPNNFYAIYNRKNKGKGFIFCAHDSEHSMMIDPLYVGAGLYENRVNIRDHADNWYKMDVTKFEDFHPQWLHYKLSNVDEYRIRFADRTYSYLSNDGVLTPENVNKLLKKRIGEIDYAIIAESARWGDARNHPVRTKIDHWIPEINKLLNTYVPVRTHIVIDQLKTYFLYSKVSEPVVKVADTLFLPNEYHITDQIILTVQYTGSIGDILYTLDGSDPRNIGGSINDKAVSTKTAKSITITSSAVLKVRVWEQFKWSALREIRIFKTPEDYSNLKITELHYHPLDFINGSDTVDDKNFEFIELKNTGDNALNISGLVFDSAVNYTIPENTILLPKGFYVIASKPEYFYERYGMNCSGNFSGQLSNSGENLVVFDPRGTELINLTYFDIQPWPYEADGDGYSLVSKEFNPLNDPNDPAYWRKSLVFNGSPFYDDDIVNSVLTQNIPEFTIYPNPAESYVNIIFNDDVNEKKIEIISCEGKLMYSEITGNIFETIDLQSLQLNMGIYLVKITSNGFSSINKLFYMP